MRVYELSSTRCAEGERPTLGLETQDVGPSEGLNRKVERTRRTDAALLSNGSWDCPKGQALRGLLEVARPKAVSSGCPESFQNQENPRFILES